MTKNQPARDERDLEDRDEAPTTARRRFLAKVGTAAVTTSAVTLMLSAGSRRSVALELSPPVAEFNEWH